MSQKMFIPVTDEILYERPELITSPLMPFQIDHPCFRWLSAETEAVDPTTVDIDPGVEVKMAATALKFAPLDREPRHVVTSGDKNGSSSNGVAKTGDQNYQRLLRQDVAVSCKDAA